ncbi:MAG: histidinol-phosphate transaminase [Saprospiraceae bacterium]
MNNSFFNDTLQNAPVRIAPTKTTARFFLDKNEQPDDVDYSIKKKVTDSLMNEDWNRYPTADNSDIEALVASYCGLGTDNIVLGPGSASFITTLLNYFALNGKRIVIAQPTYTLFDYHCKTYGIAYEPWMLTEDLEYDYENMPTLGEGSVLIVTAPNNPVGNTIKQEKLEQILAQNPNSFVIVDAVYAEFATVDFTPLVRKYENLIVLRSFSKAFPVAGLRLGYLCAAPQTAAVVRKLMLMFSINQFTLAFAREALFSRRFMERSQERVNDLIAEREWMYRVLNFRFDRQVLKVFKSEGNFLLVRIFDDAIFAKAMADFEKNGIKVLNTSPFPLLKNTFRVSISLAEQNEFFLDSLRESLMKTAHRQQQGMEIQGYFPKVNETQYQLARA